jgi:cobalt-zinc-cadmium efflux system protein
MAAHDHSHAHGADASERRIFWAMLLTGGFMLVEAVGGVLSGSLTLLADAGHMLTDVGALALAYGGVRLGRRPADPRRSYGYRRLEVLAAFVNGVMLLALTVWIAIEAVRRFLEPVEILSGPMLAIAAAGLLVNVGALWILHGGDQENINIRGALAHVVGDLLGSLAAIVAAVVILATGWTPIDSILSLFVAFLIVRSGLAVVRRSGHILLEGAPEGIDAEAIERDLATVPGVEDAHHVHVWSLTSGRLLATLHLRLAPDARPGEVLPAVKARLLDRFGIAHSTVEIDPEGCMDERGQEVHASRNDRADAARR